MGSDSSERESARLAALESYGILDSPPEAGYDDLTEVAAAICGVPISLVSFVSKDRQWFKSARGLGDIRETARELSFCAHTLATKQTLIVPDASIHPAFQNNALVTGDPEVRFYAGAPIIERDGHVLGSLCVIDTKPHTISDSQTRALEALARQVAQLLELRRMASEAAALTEKFRRSEEQLSLAVDSAGLAAWFFDPATGIVSGDERMGTFFGLATPKGPADMWLRSIVEEDRERVRQEFADSILGIPYDTTYRVAVNGVVGWLHARAKLIRRGDGTHYLAGICDDVTEEKVLALSLARTADRLGIAQQAAGVITFDWNLKDDTVVWGGDCFGRKASEIPKASDVFPFVLEPDRDALQKAILHALATGEEYQCEFRVMGPGGDIYWYSTSGRPIFDPTGAAVAVVGANTDITVRKISEAALLQSEKLAAVGRLASTIAHEINNPLEAVTNLLYLARHNPSSTDLPAWLDQADQELRRVGAIASQTLRFHRQSSSPQPVTCLSLFSSTLTLYEARLANNKVSVEKRKRANEPVKCFEGDIRQVLSNLVANSIDAMPHGGRLLVRSREGTDWRTGRAGLFLTIADTGSGMSDATRQRVFDAFYTTKGINGSGLGLWISSQIIDRHRGRILIRSSNRVDRHGTTVSLFIPFDAKDFDV